MSKERGIRIESHNPQPEVRKIPLTRGKFALVDAEDYESLIKHKWHFCGKYVATSLYKNGRKQEIYLHRFVVNAEAGKDVDHKNHNLLDNRKENLRICTRRENKANTQGVKKNTSGFKGVGFFKATSKWRAYIKVNYKFISLGHYKTKREAALAYNKAARYYFGEYAYINLI